MFFGPSGLPRSLSMSFWAWSIQLLDVGSSPCGMMRSQPKQWALIPLDTKSWHLWLGRSLLEWRGVCFVTFRSFFSQGGLNFFSPWMLSGWVFFVGWGVILAAYFVRFFLPIFSKTFLR